MRYPPKVALVFRKRRIWIPSYFPRVCIVLARKGQRRAPRRGAVEGYGLWRHTGFFGPVHIQVSQFTTGRSLKLLMNKIQRSPPLIQKYFRFGALGLASRWNPASSWRWSSHRFLFVPTASANGDVLWGQGSAWWTSKRKAFPIETDLKCPRILPPTTWYNIRLSVKQFTRWGGMVSSHTFR